MSVSWREAGQGVAILTLDAGPGNRLTATLSDAGRMALAEALEVPGRRGIVLTGGQRGFSGGIDLGDLAEGRVAAAVAAFAHAIADAPVPVIAVLAGSVIGAGAELALAARARVATPEVRIVLPDVHLGRLPVAGATQRLPRLTGLVSALKILSEGQAIGADAAQAAGLVDVVAAEPLVAACALALAPPRVAGPPLGDLAALPSALADHRARHPGDPVQAALADCIAAAPLLPMAQGLEFEATRAADCAARPEAAALVAAMQGDLRLRAALPRGQATGHLGLWGGAAAPLAARALQAGCKVTLGDPDPQALVAAMQDVGLALDASPRLPGASRAVAWDKLAPAVDVAGLHGAGIVFDARGDALQAEAPRVALGHGGGEVRAYLGPAGMVELQAPPGSPTARVAAATLRAIGLTVLHTGPGGQPLYARLAAAATAALDHRLATGATTPAIIRAAVTGWLSLPMPQAERAQVEAASIADLRYDVILAMVAEGVRALADGQALAATDIDTVARLALAFPRDQCGPMHRTEVMGLMILRRDLAVRASENLVWAPDPLLDGLVSRGGGFD